ncbi:hypothetical protein ACFQHV_17880 [Promicromonospora thailandica]|uniref:Uncharacterized protein n=1 Tax=Promicromonospora thailandica TaxID=765201 RepID=A0A9X2JU89_9MICO|nr:hypothetical protein [Promicromonospora thailandica]MCP2264270.1 hypothetical protein [Promicromonospora thailandica]BFF21051.1 hypothetical protein GCM10025730_45720 [Promicromonospora thailandica]
MPRTRMLVPLVVVVGTLAMLGLALPPLFLLVDEIAVPPASALPALPDGARVLGQQLGCGSGGCWQEVTVAAPEGMSGDELAEQVLPEGRTSAFRSIVDLRRVSSGVIDADAESARFFVQYDRWID